MTGTAKAQTGETATARQRRVWDKHAGSYDQQIAFFDEADGRVVKVDGQWDGSTLTADKAEIEETDD